ncbi:MAG: YibE/F family protein, partial [Gammaproteobacteria bacterium]|nr:YibE/F family protein [Gammaproteobacteria bacterium]
IWAILLVLAAAAAIFWLVPRLAAPTERVGAIGLSSDVVRAVIVEIVEEGEITLGERTQPYQILLIEVLEGPWQGQQLKIDYGQRQIRPPGLHMEPGDEVLVTVGQLPDMRLTAYFADFVRVEPLMWLFATFVLFSVIVSGWKGVRGLLGMAFSLGVIIFYIIPNILAGKDPLLVSITGAFILLAVTLYLIYGWTLKTHAAVLGTLISLVVTGLLAGFFVDLTRLTGFGSEDATFLIQQANTQINLRGIVLGGMLVGALGVLDDLVITQASVVFALHAANPAFHFRRLFRQAMRVGQDHVAATVNTLVLAYVGAALPSMLLFSLSGERVTDLLNLEFIAEEVVRTLVGSLGLISAVPVTTALACALALYHDRFGEWRRYLGPEDLGGGHAH